MNLTQHHYINNLVKRFGMYTCHSASLPADPCTNLTVFPINPNQAANDFPDKEAIGSLTFIMNCTRPDIAFALNQAAQFCSNPQEAYHLLPVRHPQSACGINYTSGNNIIAYYSDSDYAAAEDTRGSTAGYCLFMNSGPISWSSQRQRCPALSTTEAEYIAMAETAKEIIWMRSLLMSVGFPQTSTTPLLCDNQGFKP